MTSKTATGKPRRRNRATDHAVPSTIDVSRQIDALHAAKRAGVLTEVEYERKRAPLINALYEVAAQEERALAAGGVPLGVTIGTTLVVAGELIESTWGNQVRADLLALNAGKIEDTGDTMAGILNITGAGNGVALPAGEPSGVARAARKDYVDTQRDTRLALTGGTLSGDVQVGGDALNNQTGVQLTVNGGKVISTFNGTGGAGTANVRVARGGGAGAADVGESFVTFVRAGTVIGAINIASATTTAYVTTSDPRAKSYTGDVDDALAIAVELGNRVYRGRWRNDDGVPVGDEWVLLNSTDVERFAPFAVHGERDGEDDDGRPVYQQVNWAGLVPMLFAAIAQQSDRIAALEARGD